MTKLDRDSGVAQIVCEGFAAFMGRISMNPEQARELENALKNTSNREKALWYFFGCMTNKVLGLVPENQIDLLIGSIQEHQSIGDFSP